MDTTRLGRLIGRGDRKLKIFLVIKRIKLKGTALSEFVSPHVCVSRSGHNFRIIDGGGGGGGGGEIECYVFGKVYFTGILKSSKSEL